MRKVELDDRGWRVAMFTMRQTSFAVESQQLALVWKGMAPLRGTPHTALAATALLLLTAGATDAKPAKRPAPAPAPTPTVAVAGAYHPYALNVGRNGLVGKATIDAPGPGFLAVTATMNVQFIFGNGNAACRFWTYLGSAPELVNGTIDIKTPTNEQSVSPPQTHAPVMLTTLVPVAKAGPVPLHLLMATDNCRDFATYNISITAVFSSMRMNATIE